MTRRCIFVRAKTCVAGNAANSGVQDVDVIECMVRRRQQCCFKASYRQVNIILSGVSLKDEERMRLQADKDAIMQEFHSDISVRKRKLARHHSQIKVSQ